MEWPSLFLISLSAALKGSQFCLLFHSKIYPEDKIMETLLIKEHENKTISIGIEAVSTLEVADAFYYMYVCGNAYYWLPVS